MSCAEIEGNPGSCPLPVNLTAPGDIGGEEKELNITLSPSLGSLLPSGVVLEAEIIVKQNLKLAIQNGGSGGSERALMISHAKFVEMDSNSAPKSTIINVKFSSELRDFEGNYLNITVKEPWLYFPEAPSTASESNSTKIPVFLKKTTKIVKIKNSQESWPIRALKAPITFIVIVLGVLYHLIAGQSDSIISLIKLLNTLEIVSNLSRMNAEYSPGIKKAINFIENLKFPEIKFLANMSPLDGGGGDRDPREASGHGFEAFKMVPRAERRFLLTSNKEAFIWSGQGFIASCAILGTRIALFLLNSCLCCRNRLVLVIWTFYYILIGMVFFDFQMICTTEIALFDYSRALHLHYLGKFELSYIFSLGVYFLILGEFLEAFRAIKTKSLTQRRRQGSGDSEFVELAQDTQRGETGPDPQNRTNRAPHGANLFDTHQTLLIDKYMGSLERENSGIVLFFTFLENLRFFWIQVVIATLQTVRSAQLTLVGVTCLVYFVYFWRLVLTKKVFSNSWIKLKTCLQECCIMGFVVSICVYNWSNSPKFDESKFYQVLELFAIGAIIGATGLEMTHLMVVLVKDGIVLAKKLSCKPESKIDKNQQKMSNRGRMSIRDFFGAQRESWSSRKVSKMTKTQNQRVSSLSSLRRRRIKFKRSEANLGINKNTRELVGQQTSPKSSKNLDTAEKVILRKSASNGHSINQIESRRRLRVKNKHQKNIRDRKLKFWQTESGRRMMRASHLQ